MGMSSRQVIVRAELPLAVPLVMTGVRTAAVQVVATATLAALVGGGGLGRIINLGFGQQDYGVDAGRRDPGRRARASLTELAAGRAVLGGDARGRSGSRSRVRAGRGPRPSRRGGGPREPL